jgi:hypothetical protein
MLSLASLKSGSYYSVDLAVGPNGSEQVFLNDVFFGQSASQFSDDSSLVALLPLKIPHGQNLRGRVQGTTAGHNINCGVTLFRSGDAHYVPTFNKCRTYGVSTNGQTIGTLIDPGGVTPNKKGSWTQVTAATLEQVQALSLIVAQGPNGRGGINWLLDIGVGPSGQEKSLINDLPFTEASSGATVSPSVSGPFYVNIPQGVRLSVRAQCDTTNTTGQIYVALYCFS